MLSTSSQSDSQNSSIDLFGINMYENNYYTFMKGIRCKVFIIGATVFDNYWYHTDGDIAGGLAFILEDL